MSWINEHKNVGRVAVLVLLLVAMMGPWTYSSDGVPPAEWCRAPNILLENGRCVRLVTGATVLADRAREFLGVFLFTMGIFLLMLPFFSTLLLIRGRDSRRLRVFHLMAWGLAAVLGLLLALLAMSGSGLYSELWGIWLYFGSAAGALILEVLALVTARRLSQG